MPKEELRITLKYKGRDVDEGTMPLDEVVDALQGFAGAYSKIAAQEDTTVQHELRVSAIRNGSFDVLILAWVLLKEQAATFEALKIAAGSARWVVKRIVDVIAAKKHTKAKPYSFSVKGEGNTVVVINAEGAELKIDPKIFELFRSNLIDQDLSRIAAPLEAEGIDSVEILASDEAGPAAEAAITSKEREYFRPGATTETTSERDIIGIFVSLNKERNGGTFRLGDGRSVPYRYAGSNPEQFHFDFSRKGAVRVRCKATFDQNLNPTHLEISRVRHLQDELALP